MATVPVQHLEAPIPIEHLLQQLYGDQAADSVPHEILVPELPTDPDAATAWLEANEAVWKPWTE